MWGGIRPTQEPLTTLVQPAETFTWRKKTALEAQREQFHPQHKGVFQTGGGRKGWSQERAGEEVVGGEREECWNLTEKEEGKRRESEKSRTRG